MIVWQPFLACLFLICPTVSAQNLLHTADALSEVNLLPGDAAVLEMEEVKKDLPCVVTPVKPLMGFDLRFHSGYEISIPLKELASNGQTLTVVFSVTPDPRRRTAPAIFPRSSPCRNFPTTPAARRCSKADSMSAKATITSAG